MRIESKRLGSIEVEDHTIIELPRGLVGLPDRRRFVLLEFGGDIPLGWMQSVDDGDFGFPVGEPEIFVPNYRVDVARADVEDLLLERVEDAVILIVTTVMSGGALVTGNLRAPLLVNTENRRAVQVVLDRDDLSLRALVDPVAFARAGGLPMPEPQRQPETTATPG